MSPTQTDTSGSTKEHSAADIVNARVADQLPSLEGAFKVRDQMKAAASTNTISNERIRNTWAWAASRIGTLSGAEVIVAACEEAIAARNAKQPDEPDGSDLYLLLVKRGYSQHEAHQIAEGPLANTDTRRLDWYEAQHSLHCDIESLYTVDGFQIELQYDGNEGPTFHGEDLRDAIDKAMRNLKQPPTKAGCSVPPAGWRCTREAGHDGPCAAVPA